MRSLGAGAESNVSMPLKKKGEIWAHRKTCMYRECYSNMKLVIGMMYLQIEEYKGCHQTTRGEDRAME